MAGIQSSELLKLPGWPGGIDNRSPEEAVPADRLRAAVNIDLDDAGKVRRRSGTELLDGRAGLHSLYANDRFPLMLAIDGAALIGYDTAMAASNVVTGLGRGFQPMSYAVAAGRCWYSNGYDHGELLDDGTRRDWAPECPSGQPLVSANANVGGLPVGSYQVAITFIDQWERESGSTLAVEVDLAEGHGINLSSIPQPLSNAITHVRIYASPANGDVLYRVQDVPVGTASLILGAHLPGRQLETQFLSPLPPGSIVRAIAGRLHVADGRLHRWSEGLHYGMTRLHEQWSRFDSDITMLEPSGNADAAGLYIAAGKRTYYLSSPDPANWQRLIARTHGAVPGTATQIDASLLGVDAVGAVPVWLDTEGQFVVGLPGGVVIPLHRDRYTANANVEHGAIAMRSYRGIRHLISTLQGGETSGLKARDTATAEVWKNGVRIA